jgi:hypothetical protein
MLNGYAYFQKQHFRKEYSFSRKKFPLRSKLKLTPTKSEDDAISAVENYR